MPLEATVGPEAFDETAADSGDGGWVYELASPGAPPSGAAAAAAVSVRWSQHTSSGTVALLMLVLAVAGYIRHGAQRHHADALLM